MKLRDFAKNIYVDGTVSENTTIIVNFCEPDGRTAFCGTAKDLDRYCNVDIEEVNKLSKQYGVKWGSSPGNWMVLSFDHIILSDKDNELPEYNRPIHVRIS